MPAEKSKDFKGSTRRLLGRLAPGARRRRSPVLVLAVVSVDAVGARPEDPRPRHRHHRSTGFGGQRRRGIDFADAAPHAAARRARRSTSLSASLPVAARRCLLAGVVQRTMFRLRGRGRGQAQPAAARLRRRPAPRRPAQPGHQRHRQRRAEPPADAQPDAHVDADARRRARHDVRRSRRCWRSSRSSRSRCRSSR